MNDEFATETYDDSFDHQILNMDLFYKKGQKAEQRGEEELFEVGKSVVQARLDKLGDGMMKEKKGTKATKKGPDVMAAMKNDGFGQRVDELQFSDHGGDIEMEKLEDRQVTLYTVKGIDTGAGQDWDIDNWFSAGAAAGQNPNQAAAADKDKEDAQMIDTAAIPDRQQPVDKHYELAEEEKDAPPNIIGVEEQLLYDELKEFKELAPERNEIAHTKHLNDLWFEAALEDIQDKKYQSKICREHLEHDDQNQQLDQKQRQGLEQQINTWGNQISAKEEWLKKRNRPEMQPETLHRARYELKNDLAQQAINQQTPPQEFAFVKWYYGLFADQWRLIADVINYHPLTRGLLRCKEIIAREYFHHTETFHAELLQRRQKMSTQPWRETRLPLLINGREGCLMNSMQYLNMSHLQSIQKVNRLSREQRQTKRVFTFRVGEMGQLTVESSGERKVRSKAGLAPQAELAGAKRQRADADEAEEDKAQPEGEQVIETSAFEDQDETMDGEASGDDNDV